MSGIPKYFLDEKKPNNHKHKSDRHEKRVATKLGGTVQRGSGAVVHRRGDVKLNNQMLIECKRTDKKSFSIKREWVEKITKEAVNTGRVPALSFEFGGTGLRQDGKLPMPIEKDWIAVPLSFFNELLEKAKDK